MVPVHFALTLAACPGASAVQDPLEKHSRTEQSHYYKCMLKCSILIMSLQGQYWGPLLWTEIASCERIDGFISTDNIICRCDGMGLRLSRRVLFRFYIPIKTTGPIELIIQIAPRITWTLNMWHYAVSKGKEVQEAKWDKSRLPLGAGSHKLTVTPSLNSLSVITAMNCDWCQ